MAAQGVVSGTAALRPVEVERRRAKPVKWWAALGAFFILLQAYVFTHWIASGNATRTPTGADPVPEWMKFTVHGQEAISILGLAICIYVFVVRPRRRDGRFGFDAMFILAVALTWWQDPMYNYSQIWTTYNAEAVNLGSWGPSIPGWISPNAERYADPLLWSGPAFIWAMFAGVVLANHVVRRAKARWPRMGIAGVVAVNYVFFLVLCLAIESIWLRTGVYTYAGAIPELTLFHGHYYQLPVYEIFLFAAYWGGWALVRYFRDDRGLTVAERGLDRVTATPRRKSLMRVLALTGILNVVLLSGIVAANFFALQGGPWAKDVENRSYLTNGLCGPGTAYACSGPEVPIPRRDSMHLNPAGKLIDPKEGR